MKLSGFVASCPARVEPCNGAQQGSKVRTTTDRSWPKLEVLPDGSDELAVNPLIALGELAKPEFPKATQFPAATAILMKAEPKLARDARRDAAAAAAAMPGVHVRSPRPGKRTKVTSYVKPPITRAHASGPGLVVLGVAHTNGRAHFFSGPAPKSRSRLHIRVSKRSRAPPTTNNQFF